MTIQAVLFDRGVWDTKHARAFLARHGMRPIKPVHKTDNYLRYRLLEPVHGARYRIVDAGQGVKYIMEY